MVVIFEFDPDQGHEESQYIPLAQTKIPIKIDDNDQYHHLLSRIIHKKYKQIKIRQLLV